MRNRMGASGGFCYIAGMKLTSLLCAAVLVLLANLALAATPALELESTSWRLLRIQSLNNTEFLPEENIPYILRFRGEGRLVIESDCNAAGATWVLDAAQLQFEDLVTTNKFCPGRSLHNRFISGLISVRTVAVEGDVMTLGTTLDGMYLEFSRI